MEAPPFRILDRAARLAASRRGELNGFPPEFALLPEDRSGAKGVAAVLRQRMVEDVEDAHSAGSRRLPQVGRIGPIEQVTQERGEH